MPRFRFTLRWMMVAVAVVAVAAVVGARSRWAETSRKRWQDSIRHERGERESLAFSEADRDRGAYWRENASYHASWKNLYREAAWRPWADEPTGPSPPLPPPRHYHH